MTINPGRYESVVTAVYVAKVNGAIWDYKIIRNIDEQPMYLLATELITENRIRYEIIKTENYLTESESYLEKESANLNIEK